MVCRLVRAKPLTELLLIQIKIKIEWLSLKIIRENDTYTPKICTILFRPQYVNQTIKWGAQ